MAFSKGSTEWVPDSRWNNQFINWKQIWLQISVLESVTKNFVPHFHAQAGTGIGASTADETLSFPSQQTGKPFWVHRQQRLRGSGLPPEVSGDDWAKSFSSASDRVRWFAHWCRNVLNREPWKSMLRCYIHIKIIKQFFHKALNHCSFTKIQGSNGSNGSNHQLADLQCFPTCACSALVLIARPIGTCAAAQLGYLRSSLKTGQLGNPKCQWGVHSMYIDIELFVELFESEVWSDIIVLIAQGEIHPKSYARDLQSRSTAMSGYITHIYV